MFEAWPAPSMATTPVLAGSPAALPVELGVAEAPLVPRDHPELRGERRHLGGEHLVVHEETMGQHNGGPVTPAVLVVQPLTIDIGVARGALQGPHAEAA
jgi:hypothetical protein